MIDYKEVIDLYNKLDLNDKRNEFSTLLIKIDALLLEFLSQKNIKASFTTKKIDITSFQNKKEDDTLAFFYEDLINIKNKILLLLKLEINENDQ